MRRTALVAVLALTVGLVEAGTAVAKPVSTTAEQPKPLGPAEAEDAASALLTARLQDRRIEVTGERTDSTTTWANPDGTTTVESYTGPIRVRDEHGAWRPVDTTLVAGGGVVAPKMAAADVTLSDGGTDQTLVQVGRGKHALGVAWEGKLPKPRLNGSTATYPGAVKGGDLVVTALKEGFTHNVVLRERPDGPVEYRLPVDATGLRLKETADKRLVWEDAKGEARAGAPAPVMWDSSHDKASGEPEHLAPVDVDIVDAEDGRGQVLVLKPSAAFLSDPDVTYPVTIDPTDSLMGPTTDTWVQYKDYLTSQRGSTELKAGTYDGSEKARSFLKFNVSKYTGKHVLDAKLRLYSYYSSTCSTSNSGIEVRRITTDWDPSAITWSAQPSTTATGAVVVKDAKGYNSSCPAGYSTWNVSPIAQSWADGQPNYGLRMAAVTETDPLTWRRYRSANYVNGSHDPASEPSLTVNYNTKPGNATPVSPATGTVTNNTKPTLSAKATDPDGNTVQTNFEIWKSDGTAALQTGKSAFVASGANATWTPGTALANGSYKWRAQAYDGNDTSAAWSAWQTFTIDTTPPGTTSISSEAFPAGVWSGTADSGGNFSGSFTFTPPTTKVKEIEYKLDAGGPVTVATTGGKVTKTLTFKAGLHTVYAQTRDAAGNTAALTKYTFGAGQGSMSSPVTGDTTDDEVTLSGEQPGIYSGVTYQYSVSPGVWANIPVAYVRRTDTGAALTAWPLAISGTGNPVDLEFRIADWLGDDGPVQLRAQYSSAAAPYNTVAATVTVNRRADNAPVQDVGPGSVNLLTGDFTASSTDVSALGMQVFRSSSSRYPLAGAQQTGQAAIFGPNWTSGLDGGESPWASVRQVASTSPALGSTVILTGTDGSTDGFTLNADGTTWTAPAGSGMTLTGTTSGSTFTLVDSSGNHAKFTKTSANGSATPTWQLSSFYTAADTAAMATTVQYQAVTAPSGTGVVARPQYVVAPTSAVSADTCISAPDTRGCRVLQYNYATATTGTSTAFGTFAGQVDTISVTATNPATGTALTKTLAKYAYDDQGRLRSVYNPQTGTALVTGYSYDSAGRLATITPVGQLPWTMTYGQVGTGGNANPGMLKSVSRPTLKSGTPSTLNGTVKATTSVVYRVPVSGSNAPYQLDAAHTATWGQSDNPVSATAVFPPSSVPAGNDGTTLPSSAYAAASLSYLNRNGLEVNTAEPGGHINTTEYNALGDVTRELSAANRELALGQSTTDDVQLAQILTNKSSADAADLLDTQHSYTPPTADGTELPSDVLGPLHTVSLARGIAAEDGLGALPAGSLYPARAHTHVSYDEGKDSGSELSGLETSTSTGAKPYGYTHDTDVRSSATGYDWTTGNVLSSVVDPGNLSLTTNYTYNSSGGLLTKAQPGSSATTTIHTTYWSATGTGTCQGRPEWADLVCQTAPGAGITGGGTNPTQLPTKSYTYDWYENTVTLTETANAVTRTTTFAYDAAGRATNVAVTGGAGVTSPTTSFTYDAANGQQATTVSNGRTVVRLYDQLGRQYSYNDGNGNTATTSYDTIDRPTAVSDSVPSTTSYTYDATTGQPLALTDSAAGTFTATSYDADGVLTGEALPGGYRLAIAYDTAGDQTSAIYTDATGAIVHSDVAVYTIHGQQASRAQASGSTLLSSYTYDTSGRLSRVTEDDGIQTDSRAYTFNAGDNRTSLTTTLTLADDTATTSTTRYDYDSADRLIAEGYTYDAFGRTTRLEGNTLSYYTNDLIASETRGATRSNWALDSEGRLASSTTSTTGDNGATWTNTGSVVNHYGCGCDTPSWRTATAGSASSVTRNVLDLTGSLAAVTTDTGHPVLQFANLHGDISVQLDLDTTTAIEQRYDEYGNPLNATAAAAVYGSLGAYQRATDGLAGYTVMGVRVYNPATGRFLQTDPIPDGNTSAYIYPADPIGQSDTSGQLKYRYQRKSTKNYTLEIRRNCEGHSKCSLTWYVKLKSIWKKYGSLKFKYTITLPGYYARKNQDYGHAEAGWYLFHGSWGVPTEKNPDRGKYKVMGVTFWFDWTDNVEFTGKFTVQGICVKNPTLNVHGLFT
ncbi:DNRLRE domain-containing protein [Streptomyces sp. NPDC004227]